MHLIRLRMQFFLKIRPQMQFFAPKWSNAIYFLIVSSQLDWTSTWAPTGTVFLTYVVTLFFGIKFLLKITTGIWHQSTSARSWFYSSTLDHRCAFACVLCMWSITVCLRMNTWNITYDNFFPARSWASGGQGVCSSAGQGVPLQERFTG